MRSILLGLAAGASLLAASPAGAQSRSPAPVAAASVKESAQATRDGRMPCSSVSTMPVLHAGTASPPMPIRADSSPTAYIPNACPVTHRPRGTIVPARHDGGTHPPQDTP